VKFVTPITNLHMAVKLKAPTIKITLARNVTATQIMNGHVAVKL
jgi:hypothetical protein